MIKVETNFYQLRIYIDDLLHLSIKLKDLLAIQSWGHRKDKYIIEYNMKQTTVKSEYQNKKDWQEILKQLSLIDFN